MESEDVDDTVMMAMKMILMRMVKKHHLLNYGHKSNFPSYILYNEGNKKVKKKYGS